MSVVVIVDNLVDSGDPRQAVSQWLKTLRSGAAQWDGILISVDLYAMSDNGVLTRLAEQLPPDFMGFRPSATDRMLTASEFLRAEPPRGCAFSGKLSDPYGAEKALELTESLLSSSAKAIRSTSFRFNATNVRWKEGEATSLGTLRLYHRGRGKRRFDLSASMRCSGDSLESDHLRQVIKRVSTATGIPFASGSSRLVQDRVAGGEATAEERLIAQVCFDEAVEDAAARCFAGKVTLDHLQLAAASSNRALRLRLENWGHERSERVDLASTARCVFKATLPQLQLFINNGEEIWFHKPLGTSLETVVAIDRTFPTLGKVFTLKLGLKCPSARLLWRWDSNLFALYRTSEPRAWVYTNREEALAAVTEAAELLRGVLPHWEASLLRWFEPWPTTWPGNIERRGRITAREAFTEAFQLVRAAFPDADFIRLVNDSRSSDPQCNPGPSLAPDGRLELNSAWRLHFHSPSQDVSLSVGVPAIGRICILDDGDRYRDVNSRWILAPLSGTWLDSDQALAIAEQHGARERRDTGKTYGISARLEHGPFDTKLWNIHYCVVDNRGRNDVTLQIDAETGNALGTF
jgi:hypothetical protein